MLIGKILSPFLFMAMRIVSVIVYFLTIVSAFGGAINPDYLTFPALLVLAFPYFAIGTILLVIFWAIMRKIFICGLGILTIILCLTPLSDAFPLGSARQAEPGSQTFKIMSWNVLHTDDIRQPDYPGNRSIEFMMESGADIICLVEMKDFSQNEVRHYSQVMIDSLFTVYPYNVGRRNTFMQVLSKYPVKRLEKMSFDSSGNCRYDFFLVNFPDGRELIIGLVHLYSYGLSEEERQVVTEINSMETAKTSMQEFKGTIRQKLRNAFRQRAEDAVALRSVLDEISPDVPLIVCGDFNDVPASWCYNIIRGDDLRDAYAETNFGPAITYNLHAFYFHIDQMLYRGPLEALDLDVCKINSSDHYPLLGTFSFK